MPHQHHDIRLEVKVRNNLILTKMEARGIHTVAELCRQMKKSNQSTLGALINMKDSARDRKGEWVQLALDLADFFQCMPDELFSEPQQYDKLEENRAHAEIAYAEVQQLTTRRQEPVTPDLVLQASELRKAIGAALQHLTPREERVLRMRFGLDDGREKTLEEIAQVLGTQRERPRQIEMAALRKLKHPATAKLLLAAAGKGTFHDHSLDDDVLSSL